MHSLTILEEKLQKLCWREETQQENPTSVLSNTTQSEQVFQASMKKVTQIMRNVIKLVLYWWTNWPISAILHSFWFTRFYSCRESTDEILFWELQTLSSFLFISMGTNNQTAKTHTEQNLTPNIYLSNLAWRTYLATSFTSKTFTCKSEL